MLLLLPVRAAAPSARHTKSNKRTATYAAWPPSTSSWHTVGSPAGASLMSSPVAPPAELTRRRRTLPGKSSQSNGQLGLPVSRPAPRVSWWANRAVARHTKGEPRERAECRPPTPVWPAFHISNKPRSLPRDSLAERWLFLWPLCCQCWSGQRSRAKHIYEPKVVVVAQRMWKGKERRRWGKARRRRNIIHVKIHIGNNGDRDYTMEGGGSFLELVVRRGGRQWPLVAWTGPTARGRA